MIKPKTTKRKLFTVPDVTAVIKKSTEGICALGCPQTQVKDKLRRYLVDSGASFHLVQWKDLTAREKESVRYASREVTLSTANGEVEVQKIVDINIHELNKTVHACLMEDGPPILSLGALCRQF